MDSNQQSSDQKPTPRRGRKGESSNVRIHLVFREEPDMEKLGRAIITMAMNSAKKKTGEPNE